MTPERDASGVRPALPARELCLPPDGPSGSWWWHCDPCPQWYGSLWGTSIGSAAPGGQAGQWKSWRPTSHPPGPWLSLTWPRVWAGVFPFWWRAIRVLSTRIGILGWSRPGARLYLITLTGTDVWSMGRTLPPLSLTSNTLTLMSLILSLSGTSSYRCICLPCPQLWSPTCPDRHYVSNILPESFRPSRFQASGLGGIPGLPWR
jgi:hypothetical protein